MRPTLAPALMLSCLACSSLTPTEHADLVRALPGKKPLRVGVVILTDDQRVRAAVPDPAAPAVEMALPAGVRYCDTAVLPASLPEDQVVATIAELGAFTDVLQLPFDGRGIASRDALLQRVQDRLWPTAATQELDALLLIEGVADRGLRWSSADESLVSLDTVLWWLTWPFGVLIPDRTYAPDVALVATLYSPHDQRATPEPVDATAAALTTELSPWHRATTPILGLVLPPALLADDPDAVSQSVGKRTRELLPIELVRRLKTAPSPDATDLRLAIRRTGDRLELELQSSREVTEVALSAAAARRTQRTRSRRSGGADHRTGTDRGRHPLSRARRRRARCFRSGGAAPAARPRDLWRRRVRVAHVRLGGSALIAGAVQNEPLP
ncbi:MAG: hypothetical protein IPK26_05750 [Planctomycetes bacterium]|nr:hypothetical protein [Planctomycetota bacterium]